MNRGDEKQFWGGERNCCWGYEKRKNEKGQGQEGDWWRERERETGIGGVRDKKPKSKQRP
jgi:hypothetical protein